MANPASPGGEDGGEDGGLDAKDTYECEPESEARDEGDRGRILFQGLLEPARESSDRSSQRWSSRDDDSGSDTLRGKGSRSSSGTTRPQETHSDCGDCGMEARRGRRSGVDSEGEILRGRALKGEAARGGGRGWGRLAGDVDDSLDHAAAGCLALLTGEDVPDTVFDAVGRSWHEEGTGS